MKKVLVGCLVVAVLGGVLLAAGAYILYRAAAPVLQDARNYLEGMSKLSELDKNLTNQSAFAAPDSGELTEAQLERFVRVQDAVRQSMGERMRQFEEKYSYLKNSSPNEPPSIAEVLGSLREFGTLLVDARRFQVDALNAQNFSQSEYSWVRDRIFQAAGVEAVSRIDLKKLEELARENTGMTDLQAPELPKVNVPEKNRELVKPYLSRVDDWLPLAFFGL
jgi:hypothetical protein